ncbi:hypothetical protein ACFGVS_09445 [Mucilaginibacter sp. AW1-7]|uniref:hypothetical protein n=1 Tax=Mucilaginibacter sp. AW1-7 TaxID=3349874 RepID=UPI003F73726E
MNVFKITIPGSWKYIKEQGDDSFIGKIVIPASNTILQFDFSNNGYTNSLLPTEQEYLKKQEWKKDEYFYKPGVTYTADFNVKNERAAQMKKLGTTDSTKVHVEADPSYETKTNVHLPTQAQRIKYLNADYVADLTFRDSTIHVPIEIPLEIKAHNIQVDSTDKYVVNTIWPKNPGTGITEIYFKGRSSRLTFNIVGINLSKKDQDLALQAFKTIVIK